MCVENKEGEGSVKALWSVPAVLWSMAVILEA